MQVSTSTFPPSSSSVPVCASWGASIMTRHFRSRRGQSAVSSWFVGWAAWTGWEGCGRLLGSTITQGIISVFFLLRVLLVSSIFYSIHLPVIGELMCGESGKNLPDQHQMKIPIAYKRTEYQNRQSEKAAFDAALFRFIKISGQYGGH